MVTEIWVNIGSGSWRHQAITWTNADLSSEQSCDIHLRAISEEDALATNDQNWLENLLSKISFKSPRD